MSTLQSLAGARWTAGSNSNPNCRTWTPGSKITTLQFGGGSGLVWKQARIEHASMHLSSWPNRKLPGRRAGGPVCQAGEQSPSPSPAPLPPAPLPDQNANPQHGPGGNLQAWVQLAGWMFFFGAGFGPPLDGLHSVVGLQTYDVGAITIGGEPHGLHTNIWVFPLLGAFYSILGVLQLLLDRQLAQPGQLKPGSWNSVLTSILVLIGLIRLSAQLYEDEMAYTWIFGILAVCAHVNWYAFDRTWWGYILALLVAVAAPASEAVLMRYFDLWHYPDPDVVLAGQGLVSWTSCCYFFYTQWVASLARCLETFLLPAVPRAELKEGAQKDRAQIKP